MRTDGDVLKALRFFVTMESAPSLVRAKAALLCRILKDLDVQQHPAASAHNGKHRKATKHVGESADCFQVGFAVRTLRQRRRRNRASWRWWCAHVRGNPQNPSPLITRSHTGISAAMSAGSAPRSK